MSVQEVTWVWDLEKSPNVVGTVTWDAVPEAIFKLETTPDGRLVEFTMRARTGTALTARGLRRAPLGEMERAVRNEAHKAADRAAHRHASLDGTVRPNMAPTESGSDPERLAFIRWSRAMAMADRMAVDFAERPRTGAAGRGDAHYAAVAAKYVALLDVDPSPVKTLAEQLHLSVNTVRNLLFKARERGLLTSAGRGRAGGQLTDKAKEILSGDDQAP